MVEVRHNLLIVNCLNMLVSGTFSYYSFMMGEIDIATVSAILFLMSMVAFAYSVYEFVKKGFAARAWQWASWVVWEFLALMLLLSGFLSGSIVTMVTGIFLLLAIASSFLTSLVKSDHVAKGAFEAIFLLAAFTAIVCGYIATGSLIFGIQLLFIAAILFVAFMLSCLLPKIHAKLRGQ